MIMDIIIKSETIMPLLRGVGLRPAPDAAVFFAGVDPDARVVFLLLAMCFLFPSLIV